MIARNSTTCFVLLAACFQAGAETPATKPAQQDRGPVTAAVLDYEISMPGNGELGSQLADILTARLSIEDGIELVERARLGKIIEEQKLKLVGIVDQDQAVKVGKLVGAKLLIMGKGFMMDKKLMIVTKIVGVETSRVVGGIRQAETSKPISEAILLLSEDIARLIRKNAAKLLPKGRKLPDPIAEIRAKLGKAPRPTIAVIVPEEHRTRRPAPPPADPAVETEIKRILIACGFAVVDTGKNDLADWAREMFRGKTGPWPAAMKDADVVIVGEAFSEFALRTGELVTCAGRAEINMIDRHSGRILLADRQTRRAVDLAEAIAGKTSLQNAGHKLGLAVARELVKYKTPAAKVAPKPAAKGSTK